MEKTTGGRKLFKTSAEAMRWLANNDKSKGLKYLAVRDYLKNHCGVKLAT